MSVGGLFVGLATLDVVQQVDRLPGSNEKLAANRTWLAAGGPAAVAAIAFAALGGRARLWTALGSSPAARLVASDLAGAGVDVVDVAPPGFELAASTVLLDAVTGERAVVSGSGHAPAFGKIAGPDLAGIDVVLLDGHHAALARSAALAAFPIPEDVSRGTSETVTKGLPPLAEERSSDTTPVPEEASRGTSEAVTKGRLPVVVDAGSHKPVFDDVFPFATDVICSADYLHPAGLQPRDLLRHGPQFVAVSHGGDPLEWWTADVSGAVTPPTAVAVDTVGAGDVLHGAYCFWLARGFPRLAALQRAAQAASERVQHLGPFAWRTALSRRN